MDQFEQPDGAAPGLSEMCRSWMALDAEAHRIAGEWASIEHHLFEHHDWPSLSPAEQRQFPQAKQLDDLDRAQDEVRAKRDEILQKLIDVAAQSPTEAI